MDLDMIRSVEMFEGLKDKELEKLFQLSKETAYPAGTAIVREGAPGGMLHIVVEGKVEVRKRAMGGEEKPLAILQQGAVFGEMSLFDGYPFSASVVPLENTRTQSDGLDRLLVEQSCRGRGARSDPVGPLPGCDLRRERIPAFADYLRSV